jgi:hypothetical protein
LARRAKNAENKRLSFESQQADARGEDSIQPSIGPSVEDIVQRTLPVIDVRGNITGKSMTVSVHRNEPVTHVQIIDGKVFLVNRDTGDRRLVT